MGENKRKWLLNYDIVAYFTEGGHTAIAHSLMAESKPARL